MAQHVLKLLQQKPPTITIRFKIQLLLTNRIRSGCLSSLPASLH